MIVICTKCQAKFRVADDKIGPLGAKVRCSRCQTVFVVQQPNRAIPAAPPAAEAPPPLPPAAAPPPPDDDPFAAPVAPPDPDPFAGSDPFAASAPERSSLAVTDLSDLLGPAAFPGGAPAQPGVPEPAPSPFDLVPAFDATQEPAFASDPDPFEAAVPAASELPPMDSEADDSGGLALEDRHTPPPARMTPAPDPFDPAPSPGAGGDPFASAGGQPYDPSSFDYAPDPGEPSLALETPGAFEPDGAAAAAAPDAPIEPTTVLRAAAAPAAVPPPAAEERTAAPRVSRLRAVGMNAVALVALLVVALAILVVWRSEGNLDAASLRPSAILGAVGRGGAEKGPFAVHDVRSGVYERERGAPLLFVGGNVVSRAAAPVAAVKVSVEVLRAGAVLARGEAIAGAVPTPEELYSAVDGAALVTVASAARQRAPAEVKPGDAVPFLVAIGDAPPDLEGATIRFELAPAGSPPR